MKILYLHDISKEPNAALLDTLKDQFKVITPVMNVSEISDANFIKQVVLAHLGDDFIIMGEGLGAYWASNMAETYRLFVLLIDPVIDPKKELGIELEPIEISNATRGFALVKQQSYEHAKAVFHGEYGPDYSVLPYDDAHSLKALVESSIDDLYFYYRMRASLKFGTDFAPDEYGFAGEFAMAQLVSKMLYDDDPLNTHCVKNKQRGMYDHFAVDIAEHYIFARSSIEFALEKAFLFHFDTQVDQQTLKTLAEKIISSLPDAVEKVNFPLMKQHKDEGLQLTEQQVCELKVLNNKLIKLESKLLKDAIRIDQDLQKPSPYNWVENYQLIIKFAAYLQESDSEYDDDFSNMYAFTCELETGCSNNKEALLGRLATDYNEFPVDHPLSGFRHCWLFHQLYTVAKVSFADLLRAGYIKAKISVDALSSPLIVDSVKA